MRLSTITELPPEIVAFLEDQGIKTDSDFLSLSTADVLRKLSKGIALGDIKKYKNIVAQASSATGASARALSESLPVFAPSETTTQLCPSVNPVLPALAAHTGRVIEISGYENSKKSEFILNIVLRYLSSNSNKIVYWVDTNGELSLDKASDISSLLTGVGSHDCLERIRWSLALEVEQLYDILEEVAASAKDRSLCIGYLVVDTVTSLFGSLLTASSSHGYAWMTEMMRHLRTIAQSLSITVFVTNDSARKSPQFGAKNLPKTPALGPTFTFLTDATLWISIDAEHEYSNNPDPQLGNCAVHRIEVLKANFMVANIFGTFTLKSGLNLLSGT